ncbi:MAG: glycosyltransferase family 2 protein [Ignavibacteria bacterium]|nr:glycosyltransferase family 2 protein [Ignavibacteria bacterium]
MQTNTVEGQHKHPPVVVIIPNWNGRHFIVDCLRSISELHYPRERLQIVVVDNGSLDGSQEAIRSQFDQMRAAGFGSLQLIENESNAGAPAAYNQAIQLADPACEYIWKLDNDVTLDPESLQGLIGVHRSLIHENVGGVGGRIRNVRAGGDDPIGARLMPCPRRWTKIVEYVYADTTEQRSDFLEELDMVSGSCCLFSRRAFRDHGEFDDRFFLYYDDTELCLRFRKNGWRFFVTHRAQVYHHGLSSTASIPGCRLYYWLRNHLLLGKCFFEGVERLLFYAVHVTNIPWKLFRIGHRYAAGRYILVAVTMARAYRDFILGRYGPCPDNISDFG